MEKKRGEGRKGGKQRPGQSLPGGLLAAGFWLCRGLQPESTLGYGQRTEAQHGKPGEQPRKEYTATQL